MNNSKKDIHVRLLDFNVYHDVVSKEEEEEEQNIKKKMNQEFFVQMIGNLETGETCSIVVENFKPFFYLKIPETWTSQIKNLFIQEIKQKIGEYYASGIYESKIVKRKKLYGFDGGKEYPFLYISFHNMTTYNKVKNLWYSKKNNTDNNFKEVSLEYQFEEDKDEQLQEEIKSDQKLLPNGYLFTKCKSNIYLYESNIPPILRLFHLQEISPSGWISLPFNKTKEEKLKKTTCHFEYSIDFKWIQPLNACETRIPYKICSFDIEASSSHGEFPIPIKSYKKLATNIVDYFLKYDMKVTISVLSQIIEYAFSQNIKENSEYSKNIANNIDHIFCKTNLTQEKVKELCQLWLKSTNHFKKNDNALNIETYFLKKAKNQDIKEEQGCEEQGCEEEEQEEQEEQEEGEEEQEEEENKNGIIHILNDTLIPYPKKINILARSLNSHFPSLEGDKVTFIGSTFMKYGEKTPYLNHCLALNTCDPLPNAVIVSCKSEKEVLLGWQQLIQQENPDVIIGYNINGFDYEFMYLRAKENHCEKEFLKLSRNNDQICGKLDRDSGQVIGIEEKTIHIASGEHILKYIKMSGRLQIDLYNYFRREENLASYKLDNVAGHFIGDTVKSLSHDIQAGQTTLKSGNLIGLMEENYIHLEEIGYSVDYYAEGQKFKVIHVDLPNKSFTVEGLLYPNFDKKIRWCMAKDDLSYKDLFKMTFGSSSDRAIVAKYCLQDCNLCHYIMNKVDILTGYIEMSKICSVPIEFLVIRGQGIKLTSYLFKKCREKKTLIPVIEKEMLDDGYEGAIVLEPKCDLYLDNPVACLDFASLYPTIDISEQISHDSKVWTKEFDLKGNLLKQCGDLCFDNLEGYKYVETEYDTFKYIRKTPKAKAVKVISGKKVCRFIQNFKGEKPILPSILEELLKQRKATRKLIPQTEDEFMKNVLDKRQLGYKLTANSLYGQCGAKTSTFYDKDIAACITATGRVMLTYAKRVVEECYRNKTFTLKNGKKVKTNAEYIYGDTDSVFFTFHLTTYDDIPIRGKEALEITIELAQQAGELASSFLKQPHDLEYEKTYMPFCLLSKKRYVGMLYEYDVNKGYRKEMGIVLKRRDNAPIVKDVYGGVIDILMKEQNIQKAIDFLKDCLTNIMNKKVQMNKLIISKSLQTNYKKPESVAHKVLADRVSMREQGNKYRAGDRIPFVHIVNNIKSTKSKKILQGDKIETPNFILDHPDSVKIDYAFYITNQIMKPVQQIFALVLEKIWKIQNKVCKIQKFETEIKKWKMLLGNDIEKFENKVEKLKKDEIQKMLFDPFIKNVGIAPISNYFAKVK